MAEAQKYELREADLHAIEMAEKNNCPYQAEYIRMFGLHKLDPARWMGIRPQYEKFYKMCVEGGHPYDFYVPDYPDGTLF